MRTARTTTGSGEEPLTSARTGTLSGGALADVSAGNGTREPMNEAAALLLAAQTGEISAIEEWRRRGGDIDGAIVQTGAGGSPNLTPLQMAAAVGDVTAAATLLRCGADPDSPARTDGTAGGLPAYFDVDNDISSSSARSAMASSKGDRAPGLGSAAAAQEPTTRGWGGGGYPPLTLACRAGHTPVVSLLLRYGADTRATDEFGQTALHYAAAFGHAGTAAVVAAADPLASRCCDGGARSPRDIAERGGHVAAATALRLAEQAALASEHTSSATSTRGVGAAAPLKGASTGARRRTIVSPATSASNVTMAPVPPPTPAARAYWSVRVLKLWLERLGLASHVLPRMLDQGFDDVLFIAEHGLTDADCDAMCIVQAGVRRKITALFRLNDEVLLQLAQCQRAKLQTLHPPLRDRPDRHADSDVSATRSRNRRRRRGGSRGDTGRSSYGSASRSASGSESSSGGSLSHNDSDSASGKSTSDSGGDGSGSDDETDERNGSDSHSQSSSNGNCSSGKSQ